MSPLIANTFPKKLLSVVRPLAAIVCCVALSPFGSAQIVRVSVVEQFRAHEQRFSCTAEYAPANCIRDLQRLEHLLKQYNADSLGEWQWVLVSGSEWKPLCIKL